jgi:thiol-disulfide isomerase/thioredoxin
MIAGVRHTSTSILIVIAGGFLAGAVAHAASVEQALRLTPVQEGVEYDRPTAEEAAHAKITPFKADGTSGWIVESQEGLILRKFVDTNNDNIVDQWSYYKDGVEVYRDIDSKFTGKADQFRWFHAAGSRWGVDTNGSGKIGAWRVLSAEEATAEIVAALAKRDADRFATVLLTAAELPSLGLGKAKTAALTAKIAKAPADFRELAGRQTAVAAGSKWLQFSGLRPGTVPAGTDGATKDLDVYENVVAIVQSGTRHVQVQIGTILRVGSVWKVIDAPVILEEGQAGTATAGIFFQAAPPSRGAPAAAAAPNEKTQKLLAQLEAIDPADPKRAAILEQLADQAASPEDRATWVRQLADTISAASQSGKSPDGDKRLQALFEKLQKSASDKNLAAYVKMRQLMTGYALSLQAPKADPAKIQTEWFKSLEQYIADYPASPDAAEAMLQLGIAREYAGQDDDARKWYAQIVKDFADSPQAKKAAGAVTRLDSVGHAIAVSGKSPTGGTVDLANYRGKIVLVQYWATWSAPAKNDMPTLKQLAQKYAPKFTILSISLDTNAKDLNAYLAENKFTWPQIFEEGGPDSRLANLLGIITVPTMILVDQGGKVVNRNMQTSEIEAEVKKLLQ